jgi:hypothetical protein
MALIVNSGGSPAVPVADFPPDFLSARADRRFDPLTVDLVGYQSIFKRLKDGCCTSEIPQA